MSVIQASKRNMGLAFTGLEAEAFRTWQATT